eukprot:4997100-Lingulodinium_polyedra.AAC.1
MGKSAWRTALDVLDLLKTAEPQRNGTSDPDLLANVLANRPELAKGGKSDTRGKYLAIAHKINDKCKR